MKKSLLLTITLALIVMGANAQRLIIGEKAPELKVKEWITKEPTGNKAKLIDFFHSSCTQSEKHLERLNEIAEKFSSQLVVVIVVREPFEKLSSQLKLAGKSYYVAMDENGKSFSNYTVQYLPFSVLVDAKGRVRWFGNSTSLQDRIITENMK